jgi:hypothetical protein
VSQRSSTRRNVAQREPLFLVSPNSGEIYNEDQPLENGVLFQLVLGIHCVSFFSRAE